MLLVAGHGEGAIDVGLEQGDGRAARAAPPLGGLHQLRADAVMAGVLANDEGVDDEADQAPIARGVQGGARVGLGDSGDEIACTLSQRMRLVERGSASFCHHG